jgi:hypothetical protein
VKVTVMFIRKGIGFQQTEQSESNMVEKRHFLFPTQEMGAKTPPTPVFVCEHVNGFIYWMGGSFPRRDWDPCTESAACWGRSSCLCPRHPDF